MSENGNKPTPAELCLIAKEIFGAEDLMKANEQTDAILEKAMNLWVRASRFADRTPNEAKKLAVELETRNAAAAADERAHQERKSEMKTLDEIAQKHFEYGSGRMLAKTIKKFFGGGSSDPLKLFATLKKKKAKFDGNQADFLVEIHRDKLKNSASVKAEKFAEKRKNEQSIAK